MLARLPLILILSGIGALAMMVPAAYAVVMDEHDIARNFFYSGLLFLILSGMLGLAVSANPPSPRGRMMLLTMLASVTLLPLMLAVPFSESLPDTGMLNAWWEMVSCMTTTGATLYAADRLPQSLHLWRGLVGWMGGAFTLVAAVSIMAPLKIGGWEIMASPYGRSERFEKLRHSGRMRQPGPMQRAEPLTPVERVGRAARVVLPVYTVLTLALWVLLLVAGDSGIVALMRAMGTLSTSGISSLDGPSGQLSGVPGEAIVLVFLCFALSRRFWPGGSDLCASERRRDDPEIRLGVGIVILVAVALFLRHFIGAIEVAVPRDLPDAIGEGGASALRAFWGALFTALSYLTTTGWNSVEWQDARNWSGFTAPGLLLAGLAMMGGGVATTAGGVKLLRVYALARHGQREMDKIIHPHGIGGGGDMARRLRGEGAYLAFIFFMLFAISIAVTVMLVSIHRLDFDSATILSIAALTNTGPLAGSIPLTPVLEGTAGAAGAPWGGWAGLAPFTKAVLAGAMVVGRLETLAILALFSPELWRR